MGSDVAISEQQKPKKRRTWLIVTIVIIVLFLLLSFIAISVGIYLLWSGKKSVFSGGAVAVIRIEGIIAGSNDGGGLFGGGSTTNPEVFSENLKEALDDDSVKAIVIRVNSPGGYGAASEEMYEEMQKAAKKKPVIASVADVAASAAYEAISPATEIMALRASEVGSIGVFAEVPNLEELYRKLGIKMQIIKEGKFKTMGDPSKPLTKEERQIIQEIITEDYNNFIEDVAKARKPLTTAEVRKLATGRTWLGRQAKELGLIDRLGNFQDAIKRAAKMGKIKGEPEIITYDNSDFFEILEEGVRSLKNIGRLPLVDKNLYR